MRAAFINQTGPPSVIQYSELPDPVPGPEECLVKVSAVDVNPIDLYIRGGQIPSRLKFPYIIGRDLAGEVIGVGPNVHRFQVGDRVWASGQGVDNKQGTFAELATVNEAWLHKLPPNVSDENAVALSLVGITAHLGLVREARLAAGEILFVNGGTGGVGSSVVQIARILGATVITTAGSKEKVEKCLQLGAHLAINYKTEDVTEKIKAFAPRGVNVWWETLREPNFEKTFPLLALGGRMIVMAGREARPVFPVGPFYTRDCSVHGFAMFNSNATEQQKAAEDLNRWMSEGKLKACIDRVMPLAKAAEAHQIQEESTLGKSGVLNGKIVLKP
jgi:NADPH2:quinone reductase